MGTDKAKGVRLRNLRKTSCRWPLGGMWEHVEFFCGEPALPGCSWCTEHRKRAFSRSASPLSRDTGREMVLKDRR
jgi:hypothetical protein